MHDNYIQRKQKGFSLGREAFLFTLYIIGKSYGQTWKGYGIINSSDVIFREVKIGRNVTGGFYGI